MKNKYLLIGIIAGVVVIGLVIIIMMNSDSTTKLKCVMENKEDGLNAKSTFNISFKENKMKVVESKSEIILTNDKYKKNIDLVYNTLLQQYDSDKKEDGVIIKTNKNKDSVSLTVTVDANKNPEKVSLVGSSITNEMNYDKVKESLEKQGYSCK